MLAVEGVKCKVRVQEVLVEALLQALHFGQSLFFRDSCHSLADVLQAGVELLLDVEHVLLWVFGAF